MNQYTGSLYAEPSFSEGLARILDFGNTLSIYNSSPSDQEADFWAFYADYAAIGDDLRLILGDHYDRKEEVTRPTTTHDKAGR